MDSPHTRTVSYWLDSAPDPELPIVDPPASADVVVVGGGITGIASAYTLAREGLKVALVEADRLVSGVTGNTTAKVTSQHGLIYAELAERSGEGRARAYGQAQEAALARIAALVEDEDLDCDFRRMPACVYTESYETVPALRREAEVAARIGLPARLEGQADLPFDVRAALFFDDQAIVHPRRFCLGLADAFRARGGIVAERARALKVRHGDPCVVVTDRGEVRAPWVVLATQVPFPLDGAFFARTQVSRSYVIAAPAVRLPDAVYISADEPIRSIRPHPGRDGDVLLLGGGGHPTGQGTNLDRFYRDLERWGRDRFRLEPRWRWSAQDFITHDRVPFIGAIAPRSPNVLVATGFRKWGMTNAFVAAMLFADRILGRGNLWAETFDATRLEPARSAKTIVSQGLATVKSVVGDRVKPAPRLQDLEPGSGAVVSIDGRRVAAFRDEDGTVQAVSATCTHLGCVVHFNDAERSWDCPCHGSRFALDGRVLDGPATRALAPIDVAQEARAHGDT